jgi:predicted MPP superfamily phosphohydrolase
LVVSMKNKLTRRTFLKRGTGLLTLFGLGSAAFYYANRIEPGLLKINSIQMAHPNIPEGFDGVKIVQFSDTHLGFQYNINQFTKLIKKINLQEPDLILFTGDLLDEPNQFQEFNQVLELLTALHAPLGKFCIYGNHDHGGYGSEIYRNIMESAGFIVLLNKSRQIKRNNSRFSLIGIDDAMLGSPDLQKAMKNVPDGQFKLLLSHAPDLAEHAYQEKIHWQLSGHSHGGQVKIPLYGALVKPPYGRIYTEGYYSIGESEPLSLYVNRGIGTTRLPFRFLAVPELTVFTMKSLNNR